MTSYKNTDNMLVVTIGIQMHGTVITGDLDEETRFKFNNTRLLSKSGVLKEFETCVLFEYIFSDSLNNIFRKNIETSTYDMLSNAKTGIFLGDIPFDKLITTDNERNQGVYLTSIHKGRELIYPNQYEKNIKIDLLDISDLNKLANDFGSEVPRLSDLSTPLPSSKIYKLEEERIEQDASMTDTEKETKIKQIKRQFYDAIKNWSLTLNSSETKIQSIKLSVLVEMIKIIIGQPCVINLLDFSCSGLPDYKYTDTENWTMPTTHADIESGVPYPNLGGRKKYSKKRNVTMKKVKRVKKQKKVKN